MSIWLQKSASIQKRTSPVKFDHFRYPKADFTASDLSTKVPSAAAQDARHDMKVPKEFETSDERDWGHKVTENYDFEHSNTAAEDMIKVITL